MAGIGIISARSAEGLYQRALAGRQATLLGDGDLYELLDRAAREGLDPVIVDASAVGESIAHENELVDWLVDNAGVPPRVIISSEDLPSDDFMLYRAVTMGHVNDVVLGSLAGDMEREIAKHVDHPASVMDVSGWVTDDKDLLTRPKENRFSIMKGHDGRKRKADPRTPQSIQAEAEAERQHPQGGGREDIGGAVAPKMLQVGDIGADEAQRARQLAARAAGDQDIRGQSPDGGTHGLGAHGLGKHSSHLAGAAARRDAARQPAPDGEHAAEAGPSPMDANAPGATRSAAGAERAASRGKAADDADSAGTPERPSRHASGSGRQRADGAGHGAADGAAGGSADPVELEVERQVAVYDALLDMGILDQEGRVSVLEREHSLRRGRKGRTAEEIASEEEGFREGLSDHVAGGAGGPGEEEGMAANEKNMAAHRYIAVAGTRSGIGCTSYAYALASTLASRKLRAALVMSDRGQFHMTAQALSPVVKLDGGGWSHDGVDVWFWDDHRDHVADYDYLVFDCGAIDLDSPSDFGATRAFKMAALPVMLLSGAPWDSWRLGKVLDSYQPAVLSGWQWVMHGGSATTFAEADQTLRDRLNSTYRGLFRMPWREDPTAKVDDNWKEYGMVMKPVLPRRVKDALPSDGKPRASAGSRRGKGGTGQGGAHGRGKGPGSGGGEPGEHGAGRGRGKGHDATGGDPSGDGAPQKEGPAGEGSGDTTHETPSGDGNS